MKVIAHRGSSQLAPENTLPAIKKAVKDGVNAIEIDVQMTSDQKVITFHDEWLFRTTNGTGFVFLTPYLSIKKLDAGSWFHRKFKGTKIPLLEEVLSYLHSYPVELHIELKNNFITYHGLEEKVIQLVQEYGMENKVVLSSFRERSLHNCRKLSKKIKLGYLCWRNLPQIWRNNVWHQLQLHSVHPHISLVDQQIYHLQEQGLKVYPYVIRRKKQLERCLKYKVDGVFTDCPKRVIQLLQRKG